MITTNVWVTYSRITHSLVPSPSHPSFYLAAVEKKLRDKRLGWEGLGMRLHYPLLDVVYSVPKSCKYQTGHPAGLVLSCLGLATNIGRGGGDN